jgi:aminoglycoside 6'-N-acetyltransferase I
MTLIRPVTPADRDEWLRLLVGLYPDVPREDHEQPVDAFFGRGSCDELLPSAVLVCEIAPERLGGFVELSVRNYAEGCAGVTPYVESWFVEDGLRGRGVGRLLMEAAERWALEQGYTELASDALLENTNSHSAHRAVGFEEVERVVHFRKSLDPRAR